MNLLQIPFPRIRNTKKLLGVTALMGGLAGLFLLFFKPFGIANDTGIWYVDIIILGFGIVFCFSIIFMEWLIPKAFPSYFRHWTVGKAILWYILVILVVGFNNFLYKSFWAEFEDFSWTSFGLVFRRTISIGIFILFAAMGLVHYFTKGRIRYILNDEKCVLVGDNNEKFECEFYQILYFESDNNYVDVHLLIEGYRKKWIIRSSLKKIETQLTGPTSPVIRCHRRYLINVTHFQITAKHHRSLTIGMENQPDQIQVSRNHVSKIKRCLSTATKSRPIPHKQA